MIDKKIECNCPHLFRSGIRDLGTCGRDDWYMLDHLHGLPGPVSKSEKKDEAQENDIGCGDYPAGINAPAKP